MIIGAVEKIEFVAFGLDLLEPNALITDGILGLLCVFWGLKISRLPENNFFFTNWKRFLLLFGAGAILGGIGHTFYNYFGISGKTPSWILSVLAVYFIEFSMISIHPNEKISKLLGRISLVKLVLVTGALIIVLSIGNPVNKEALSILFVVFNSLMGVTLSAGLLSYLYYRMGLSDNYLYLLLGVLIMLPSAAIFLWDVNLSRWFDKNDFSHVLLCIGIAFFYIGILRLFNQQPSVLYLRKDR